MLFMIFCKGRAKKGKKGRYSFAFNPVPRKRDKRCVAEEKERKRGKKKKRNSFLIFPPIIIQDFHCENGISPHQGTEREGKEREERERGGP